MNNLVLACLFFSSFSLFSQPVTLEWAKGIGGNGVDGGHSISVDKNGFIYTVGLFMDTVDFDHGPGTTNLISNGMTDVFVQKLDSQGNHLWAKSFGGSKSDYCYSVSVDDFGNVYLAGRFEGIVDFDPGSGVNNLVSTQFRYNTFIVKLNSSGNLVWAKSFKGDNYNNGYYHTTDGQGNLYITGGYEGIVDFDPGPSTFNLTSSGNQDIYVVKLAPSGNLLWAKTFGGTDLDASRSLAIDKSGNCYITGAFEGTSKFDPSSTNFDLVSNGSLDIFVAKLDYSGAIKWAHSFGSSSEDWGMSMATDKDGNVFTTGSFQNSPDFDPGPGSSPLYSGGFQHIFLQKLDSLGNFVWARSIGSASTSNLNEGTSVVTDRLGNVFFAGKFFETIDLDPGLASFRRTAVGIPIRSDFFVTKLDSLGNFYGDELLGRIMLRKIFTWLPITLITYTSQVIIEKLLILILLLQFSISII